MHGIPAIGINLHIKGTEKWEDLQTDILSGDEIYTGMICLIPELGGNPQVQKAMDAGIAPTIDTGVGCWHTLIGESNGGNHCKVPGEECG